MPCLSPKGHIIYTVTFGKRFTVGRATLLWEISQGRYRLSNVTEALGLASLFGDEIAQYSEGRVNASGLIPEKLRTVRDGEATDENARLDWKQMILHMDHDGGQQHPLLPGTQDLSTFAFQLGCFPEAVLRQSFTMPIVTGKKYKSYRLKPQKTVTLELPIGRLHTLHLKARDTSSTTEVWLSPEKHWLPVKIRFTNKKGYVFEQAAKELVTES